MPCKNPGPTAWPALEFCRQKFNQFVSSFLPTLMSVCWLVQLVFRMVGQPVMISENVISQDREIPEQNANSREKVLSQLPCCQRLPCIRSGFFSSFKSSFFSMHCYKSVTHFSSVNLFNHFLNFTIQKTLK